MSTSPPATSPNKPFPVIHYDRLLIVDGQPVHAGVTNLTAAFLDQLGDDPELVGQ